MRGMLGLVDKEEFVSFSLSAPLVALCVGRETDVQPRMFHHGRAVSCLSAVCLPVDEAEFAKILEAGLNLRSMTTVFFLFFPLSLLYPARW